ncbi:MAG: chaperone modulator CbpM, partial [Roseobacter sp.]|nr:chaperone modulator CbpM [Roseobacter sp.]
MKKAKPTAEILESLTSFELCRFCNADETWVTELVEYGVLDPEGATFSEWHFHGINIVRAKKARRLQRDLGINTPGVAMVLDLLQERESLLRALHMAE